MKRSSLIFVSFVSLFTKLPFSFVFFLFLSSLASIGKRLVIPSRKSHIAISVFFLLCFLSALYNYIFIGVGQVPLIVSIMFFILNFLSFRYDLMVFWGMFLGLTLISLISLFEIITNVKLIGFLYPDAYSQIDIINSHRLYVSSLLPNYNNFSYSMFFLNGILISIYMKVKINLAQKIIVIILLVYNLFICTYMGSRGFILATVLYFVFFFYKEVKSSRVRSLLAILSIVMLFPAMYFIFPALMDNSNSIRLKIISDYFSLVGTKEFYFGFGELSSYVSYLDSIYGVYLHDPHNLFLEVSVIYGFIPFLVLVFIYLFLLLFFCFNLNPKGCYEPSVCLIVLFLLLPLIGAVPSSSLFYYQLQCLLLSVPVLISSIKRENKQLSYMRFV